QQDWAEKLTKFVQTYPTADDTPDAMLQLGQTYELLGKDTEAKNWYKQLAEKFAGKPQAAKAAGAQKRIDSGGRPLHLAGPLASDGKPFDIASLKGQVVIVYYWASWNSQAPGDFLKLKQILDGPGKPGASLVTVNLDNELKEAAAQLASAPGTHL